MNKFTREDKIIIALFFCRFLLQIFMLYLAFTLMYKGYNFIPLTICLIGLYFTYKTSPKRLA